MESPKQIGKSYQSVIAAGMANSLTVPRSFTTGNTTKHKGEGTRQEPPSRGKRVSFFSFNQEMGKTF